MNASNAVTRGLHPNPPPFAEVLTEEGARAPSGSTSDLQGN